MEKLLLGLGHLLSHDFSYFNDEIDDLFKEDQMCFLH